MRLMHVTALVAGGACGPGLELARQLVARDNTVIVLDASETAVDAACEQLPDLHAYVCELGNRSSLARVCQEIASDFPHLNVLINAVGPMRNLDLTTGGQERDLTDDVDVCLTAPIQLTASLVPRLLQSRSAAIINITSCHGAGGLAAAPAYSASKAGLTAFTLALRAQLEGSSIEVFEVAGLAQPWDAPDRSAVTDAANQTLRRHVARALRRIEAGRPLIQVGRAAQAGWIERIAQSRARRISNAETYARMATAQ
ncbi:hypothetical protein LTR94_027510 [Friedmanniomyces endolithicus]|nr:hypothetical protein LTR94_027510 [Friedmanniomyces endolithicus]